MTFHLTDACRAAIADAANRRTERVVFQAMAIGDGLAVPGVDDAARPALRNERQRQNLAAVTGSAARIGVRASFTGAPGDQVWSATEVGLFAQVDAAPLFLAAYGAVGAGAGAYAVIAPGVSAVIAATVDVVASAAAVAVAVTPDVTVEGASTFAALLDTGALTPLAYYRGAVGGLALEARSAAQVLGDLSALIPRAAADRTEWNAGQITAAQTTLPAGWTLAAGCRLYHRQGTDIDVTVVASPGGTELGRHTLRNPGSGRITGTSFYLPAAVGAAVTAELKCAVTVSVAGNSVVLAEGTFILAIPPG